MKKLYLTIIVHLDFMIVSAGKVGAQIELAPVDLKMIVNATSCEEILNKVLTNCVKFMASL